MSEVKKPKPTKAAIAQRIEEVLRIRLDGAEFWDVREYARGKEAEEGSAWHLEKSDKPLSDGQLRRYLARVDRMIAESCRAQRKKLLRRHLAQRRNLYAKAVNQGDIRTALAVLQDEAKLLDLYAPAKVEHSGPGGAAIAAKVSHDVAIDLAPYADLIRQFCTDPGGGTVPSDRALQPLSAPQADAQASALPAPR